MTLHALASFESIAQAAQRVGVSVWTLRRRSASGDLVAYTAGRSILRVRPADVDALFQERTRVAP